MSGSGSVDGAEIGVVDRRGDASEAAYALDQAVNVLRYYNDYFGVHFPCLSSI